MRSLPRIGPLRAAVICLLEPVVATAVTVLVFHTQFAAAGVCGILLILGDVLLNCDLLNSFATQQIFSNVRREYEIALRIDTAQMADEEACDRAGNEGGDQRAFADAFDGSKLDV